jgi:hypothetical protein
MEKFRSGIRYKHPGSTRGACKREWIRKVVEGRRRNNRLGYSVKLAVLTTKTY